MKELRHIHNFDELDKLIENNHYITIHKEMIHPIVSTYDTTEYLVYFNISEYLESKEYKGFAFVKDSDEIHKIFSLNFIKDSLSRFEASEEELTLIVSYVLKNSLTDTVKVLKEKKKEDTLKELLLEFKDLLLKLGLFKELFNLNNLKNINLLKEILSDEELCLVLLQ